MAEQNTIDACVLPNMPALPSQSDDIGHDIGRYLEYHLGRFLGCNRIYLFEAMSYTVRDRIMSDWRNTWCLYRRKGTRKAHYLSLEYLIGRSLGNHLHNLDLEQPVEEALKQFAISLEEVEDVEPDAGLGNGGLGRLAACFLDSCATLGLPVTGYGLRYEYGMFHQHIENGYQVEDPDHWMRDGHPWEVERPEYTQRVRFGGHTEHFTDQLGRHLVRWADTDDVLAVPYDVPVTGYRNSIVNTLRLWSASATDEFDLHDFNAGDYADAVASKNEAENITMVLYPNDSNENGKELRLRQQYFLSSASLQDAFRQWADQPLSEFPEGNIFQLNDTHPSIAVAEMMRILLDDPDKRLPWREAWDITSRCMAYTNHTLLPEALERWPVRLFEQLLPRLLEIIYEINGRFLSAVRQRWPGDNERVRRMSLIEEGGSEPQIRMAWLAIVGSSSVNGVAAPHSNLLKAGLFKDFYEMWPEKFNNKTNGVTPRRWLGMANPELAHLLTEKLGDGWQADLGRLAAMRPWAENGDIDFQQRWQAIRYNNKQRLAELVKQHTGVTFDPSALFDIQVKRIHEYKRQLLNVLHVIHLYNRIRGGDTEGWVNRCVLIGGKAAPGYQRAKEIVKLINNVASVVNNDPAVGNRLKVVFLPNYGVSKMMKICPAADLSEQISTAGKEASGTGNMKFMMNGSITIGTYDGANIEIMDAVGEDNFFLFGLRAEEVEALRGNYDPQRYIDDDPDLAKIFWLLESDHFSGVEPGLFRGIIDGLKSPDDPWVTLADFRSYVDAQRRVEQAWRDPLCWTRMSIRNCAASGSFSTDRTISEYNDDIWHLEPVVADFGKTTGE